MKPINNPRPIKTVTGKKPDQSTLCGVRFKIKQDCDGRTPKIYKTDSEAVERHRKLEDIAQAKAMGMSLAEYRTMMGIP